MCVIIFYIYSFMLIYSLTFMKWFKEVSGVFISRIRRGPSLNEHLCAWMEVGIMTTNIYFREQLIEITELMPKLSVVSSLGCVNWTRIIHLVTVILSQVYKTKVKMIGKATMVLIPVVKVTSTTTENDVELRYQP